MNNIKVKELQAKYITTNKIVTSDQISCSSDSAKYARKVFPIDINHKEAFIVLLMNRSNKVIAFSTISIGGVHGTVVDPKIVFQQALLSNACSMILCHNHPSGNLQPSTADNSITEKLVSGGELLEIKVLDHIILTEDSYYSYADNGKI